jgi:hypothetical protein
MDSPPPAQPIVSAETAGLGNRIKSWVSAMRLGDDVRVQWTVAANMPAAFDQLFSNPIAIASVPPGARLYSSWRLAVLPEDEPHLPAGFAVVGAGSPPPIRALGKAWWSLTGRRSDRYRFMLFPKSHSRRSARRDARHIDLEYERIPQYFRDVYCPLFRRIAVRPEIVGRVNEWAERHIDAATIGVQVRTWRDDPRRHRKYHLPAWRRLLSLLDEAEPGARFFVVSDSDDVVPRLQERYGRDRTVQFARRTARNDSWRTAEGIVEDLTDMLLLARTNRLYASYLSTFGEAAWWLGGTTARVAVF